MSSATGRRRVEVIILLFLVLAAFSAVSSGYWIQWAFLASIWLVVVLLDFLFLGSSTFIYDPDYANWAARSGYASNTA